MDPAPRRGPRSVLIVDDNDNARQVLVDYATMTESEVLQASNGLEALWIVKHQRPELVLLDLTMPRLGGQEAIRHIRKFDPGIRIVVVTGDASEQTRREVEGLGLELLLKPIDLEALDALFGVAPRATRLVGGGNVTGPCDTRGVAKPPPRLGAADGS